jgi:hypothetical protein
MQAKILTFPLDRARCPGSDPSAGPADVVAFRARVVVDPWTFGVVMWFAMWGMI